MADGAFDADSTLLDGDVMLVMAVSYRGHVPVVEHRRVNEVLISIKKSKTEQGRTGVTRSVERTGHP